MAAAKLNVQHDYITLRVKFDGKKTLNLTRSRNGTSMSGTEATRPALEFFDRWFAERKGSTVGDSMKYLADIAGKAHTAADFIQAA